jgi:uncharacterized LabA/DUF88 family protein
LARLAIFIDGGYVDALCRTEFGGQMVDYGRLSEEITTVINSRTAEPLDLLRAMYYHCPPYQSNPPTLEESQRTASFRSFEAALSSLPRFTVRLGRLQSQGIGANGRPIFVQKQVDLMLGLDIGLLSAKGQIQHIALVAGDSDLLPAVRAAKNEGVSVWLFHGPASGRDGRSTYSRELWMAVDDRVEIDAPFVGRVARALPARAMGAPAPSAVAGAPADEPLDSNETTTVGA